MFRILLVSLYCIFAINAHEYYVSICNMSGERINLRFNDSCYDLSFGGACALGCAKQPEVQNRIFLPINTNELFGFDCGCEVYIKMTENSMRGSTPCRFWIDGYPETQINMKLSWYSIFGKSIFLDKYYIASCKNQDPFINKIIITKYVEDNGKRECFSYKRFGQLELNLHRKPLCNIQ